MCVQSWLTSKNTVCFALTGHGAAPSGDFVLQPRWGKQTSSLFSPSKLWKWVNTKNCRCSYEAANSNCQQCRDFFLHSSRSVTRTLDMPTIAPGFFQGTADHRNMIKTFSTSVTQKDHCSDSVRFCFCSLVLNATATAGAAPVCLHPDASVQRRVLV